MTNTPLLKYRDLFAEEKCFRAFYRTLSVPLQQKLKAGERGR